MENIRYKYKLLGLVTLFNLDAQDAAKNIKRYVYDLDELIIWDNSSLEKNLRALILHELDDVKDKIMWKGDGENRCIAQAINFAWHYAKEHGLDFLLLMDQDSQWADFASYRQEIETHCSVGETLVYTPYVVGFDFWRVEKTVHKRRLFINSGTVIPVTILDEIGGADEAFPLDALDTDLSYRIRKAGHQIACLTNCKLHHTIGHPVRKGPLHIFTNDYGRFRTYSITRSHIISYRKHRDIMTAYECRKFFKEIFWWKFVRLVLAEEDKIGRFKMFFKGIWDGVSYKIKK